MDVCTACCTFSLSRAPIHLDITTLHPTDMPLKRLVIKNTSELVAPTAANAISPENLPTTIISAALNNICNKAVAIKGTENKNTFFINGPWTISIS